MLRITDHVECLVPAGSRLTLVYFTLGLLLLKEFLLKYDETAEVPLSGNFENVLLSVHVFACTHDCACVCLCMCVRGECLSVINFLTSKIIPVH